MEIPGYKIERQIGKGGMATVYLATQQSLKRHVVLKVMEARSDDGAEFARRFLNEGHLLAAVNHPNVITIYDIGITEDFPYISMEYLGGQDLTGRLATPMPPAMALDIVYQIAGALAVAHAKGIIHRDVKPANILFRDDGTPVLTDFGIAKHLGDTELTSTGTILGSPYYMSPEQVEGKTVLDGRSDIYSLGVILYEMIMGRRPFEGESAINIVLQHLQSPVPPLDRELRPYQPLINLMLAKNRHERFPDAERLRQYIRDLRPASGAYTHRDEDSRADTGQEERNGSPRRYMGGHVTQQLELVRRRRRVTWSILGVVVLAISTVLTWYFITELERYENISVAPIDRPVRPAPATEGLSAADGQLAHLRSQVTTALGWLARRSLADKRLTSPPGDNAYYYFNRLLEVEPGNPVALQGIAQVASAYADMAEQAVKQRDYPKAEQYLALGLQVDPDNKRLQVLRSNVQLRERSILESFFGLLGE
ncbi:MAG: protein kinase [Gammaproteobacteria bacterium]|nr:protein kinase [Gammaproteobacteria bacterium]